MRACVIFNPAAKGQKAARFRRCLDAIAAECVLKKTAAAGDARKLAAEAVREGFETVIAAGGDGTLNEVLNGLGDTPEGFERARIGVVPLGTVNVFARDIGLPLQPDAAWAALRQARESHIDLGCIEHNSNGTARRDHFIQMAGAGLDARAVELVNWPLKKRIGPFAYVLAGLQALLAKPAAITIAAGTRRLAGQLVLIGNGRLYGGPFQVFPGADMRDGLLEVCVFPQAGWGTLLRCGLPMLAWKKLPETAVVRLRVESFELAASGLTPFEMDGELAGRLPAKFTLKRNAVRVLLPN